MIPPDWLSPADLATWQPPTTPQKMYTPPDESGWGEPTRGPSDIAPARTIWTDDPILKESADASSGAANLTAGNGSPGPVVNQTAAGNVSFWGGFSDAFTGLLGTAENLWNTAYQGGWIEQAPPSANAPQPPATTPAPSNAGLAGLGVGGIAVLAIGAWLLFRKK